MKKNKMEYKRIEKIKRELGDKREVSLLMLQDLQRHVDKLITDQGTESEEQYRII